MKKVIIAPDSFKGTLTSEQVCAVISEVLRKNYPDLIIKEIPVADGGEGTSDALHYSLGGEKVYCRVLSPLGREIEAYFLNVDGKTAVVESALASGLTLEEKRNALQASSYGTGQLIKAALDNGAEKIIVGIGGSAMTDAGTGCLSALGVRFFGDNGEIKRLCGEKLADIREIDLTEFDARVTETEITLLCDVKNPLYGENGAAYIFAPQKGATEREVRILDEGLRSFSDVCKDTLGEDYSLCEGAGAAGGLGFAVTAFMNAEVKSGIECVLDLCDFKKEVSNADLIITGEGRLDSQSLMGKVPFGVACRSKGKRIIAVVGTNDASSAEISKAGISEIIECNDLHLPFDEIKHCAKEMLYAAAEKIKL